MSIFGPGPRHPRRLAGARVLLAALVAVGVTTGCQATLDATAPTATSGKKAEKKAEKKSDQKSEKKKDDKKNSSVDDERPAPAGSALKALAEVKVKGRSAKTGYDRDQFGSAWADTDHNGCDQRNDVLRRDLTDETLKAGTHGCVVLAGDFTDPYTGEKISFRKAAAAQVQIDHVVALENAWVTGASGWTETKRKALATDPLNLLAAKGSVNQSKGSGDAATWLPPRKAYRCAYVARQVAVKVKYGAWMTKAEHAAVERILSGCPTQKLPTEKKIPLG